MPLPAQALALSSHLGSILDVAVSDYQKNTGEDPLSESFCDLLQPESRGQQEGIIPEGLDVTLADLLLPGCRDPIDGILAILQNHVNSLAQLRDGNRGFKLMKWISSLVHILYPISAIIGDTVGLVRLRKQTSSRGC